MFKRGIVSFVCFFVLFCFCLDCFAKSIRRNKRELITAESAIVVDLSKNKFIYSKNIHTKRAPASTIKILTALIAIEELGSQAEVEISENASSVSPSKVWLTPGASYNSLDLVNAVLLSSANDASVALAEAVAGSEAKFAKKMNKKARLLGAKNSNFINASGLPAKGQYSTAYDLYRITKAAFKNPTIHSIMKKKREKIKASTGKEITLTNHNKLVFKKQNPVVLLKTGYTKSAKHCYAGMAYLGKKKYVIVILKSRSPWRDIDRLVELMMSSENRPLKGCFTDG